MSPMGAVIGEMRHWQNISSSDRGNASGCTRPITVGRCSGDGLLSEAHKSPLSEKLRVVPPATMR
jgi:hypothetical protein